MLPTSKPSMSAANSGLAQVGAGAHSGVSSVRVGDQRRLVGAVCRDPDLDGGGAHLESVDLVAERRVLGWREGGLLNAVVVPQDGGEGKDAQGRILSV